MTYEEALRTIPPGRYRHFKGNEYEVIGVARHSETEEPMVVYKALYGEGGIWVRPASMWNETVQRDGKTLVVRKLLALSTIAGMPVMLLQGEIQRRYQHSRRSRYAGCSQGSRARMWFATWTRMSWLNGFLI